MPKIFLDSIPKAGAHLAEKAMGLLGYERGARSIGSLTLFGRNQGVKSLLRRPIFTSDLIVASIEMAAPMRTAWVRRRLAQVRPGQYLRGHVRYSEYFARLLDEDGFRVLHVVRDPRDVVVSHAHYMMDRTRHPMHRFYRDLGDWPARLAFSIKGGPVPGVGYLESLSSRYRSMERWRQHPGAISIRFEDLVGEAGGGSEAAQTEALAKLCSLLGVAPDPGRIEELRAKLYGGTSTFRRGQAGGWTDAFDAERIELFRRETGDLLERWGYTG